MTGHPELFAIELGDWPGGSLEGMECMYPDAPDGGMDLVLPVLCPVHRRSVWWCPNAGVLWCDGGPGAWPYHTLIVALSHLV